MNIALCYESVLPARGGAETYIGDLSRRLARDGHEVHLYACRWDPAALPESLICHRLEVRRGPRFLRPWRFAQACETALASAQHDVSVGFDKTWGQDVLYPQGGLHAASRAHNRRKHSGRFLRMMADVGKAIDPAAWSFARLERKQYLGLKRPTVVVNSRMVRQHFHDFYGIDPASVRVIYSAIDPARFHEADVSSGPGLHPSADRVRLRQEERQRWGVGDDIPVGLFVAMNYRLKGLAPLIRAVAAVPADRHFRIAVVGHPSFKKYAALAKKLGVTDRLMFLGFRADPKQAYFAADFLVHPTFYDPCSLVALEALACGLPVITTRFNGASELLSPPADGLVLDDPHDAPTFAAALMKMLDPDTIRSARAAALVAAQRWTFEHHYQALLEVFRDVAQKKPAAGKGGENRGDSTP